jgi:hypothetical protein
MAVAPRVPLMAPAVANPVRDIDWISKLLANPHPGLGVVSGHRYPYSACVPRRSPRYPTIRRLVSERATAGMARQLIPAINLAHRAGLPFRLTEVNSVTCGGVRGVSNTFATALWAPDALFELLRAGVNGVNVHVRALAVNAAFALDRNGLTPRPLLYGLILFVRTLGPGARLTSLQLRTRGSVHVKAWAAQVADHQLHVLLINKAKRPATVELQLPARGPATAQRLLAPSLRARAGVTLNGQQLGANGRWHGRPTTQTIAPTAGRYTITLRPTSAALVQVGLSET